MFYITDLHNGAVPYTVRSVNAPSESDSPLKRCTFDV